MASSVVLITDSLPIAGLVHGACRRDDLVILSAGDLLQGRMLAELARPAAILCTGEFASAEAVLSRAAAIWGAELIVLGEPRAGVRSIAGNDEAIASCLRSIAEPPRADPPADDMLAQVRARYADSLGEKAAALVVEIDAALEHPDDAALRESSCRLAHRLRGSAGSYGFPAFGEVAAAIDDLLRGPFTAGDMAVLASFRRRLALWDGDAEPLADRWPTLCVVDESPAVIGEVVVAATGLRARVCRADSVREAAAAALCLVVSAVAAEEASRAGIRAPMLVLGAAEVMVFEGASSTRFARRALAERLPALLSSWIDRPAIAAD